MSTYRIQNEFITAEISARGAALQSLRTAEGTEYLWQRDARWWGDSDLTIFPYVARLTEGKYIFQGKEYEMPIHGIAPYAVFEGAQEGDDAVSLKICWNEETLKQYPFRFALTRKFQVRENTLTVTAIIENQDEKTMFFGYGGHPGFNVPIKSRAAEEHASFNDYAIRFESPCQPLHIIFTDDCFVTDERRPFPLQDGRILPLDHHLFDNDAIILENMTRDVSLCDEAGRARVRVRFPDQPYLGLWHAPRTEAPYICIEPWSSLPSRKDIVEDIGRQEDLLRLDPGEVYTTSYEISVF